MATTVKGCNNMKKGAQRLNRLRLAVLMLFLLILAVILLVNDATSKDVQGYEGDMITQATTDEIQNNKEEVVVDKVSKDDMMLLKIAKAEAGNQGVVGQALVMCVVMNRVRDGYFPDNIRDVIHQPKQFSPIANGAYDKSVPTEETYEALELVKQGWDRSHGSLYFRSQNTYDTWHYQNLEFLFEYKDHWFFK